MTIPDPPRSTVEQLREKLGGWLSHRNAWDVVDALIAAAQAEGRQQAEQEAARRHENDEGPLKLDAYGRRCYRAGQEQAEQEISRLKADQATIAAYLEAKDRGDGCGWIAPGFDPPIEGGDETFGSMVVEVLTTLNRIIDQADAALIRRREENT